MSHNAKFIFGAVIVAACTSALHSRLKAAQSSMKNCPPGAMQQRRTTACLECHEARIILQQRLSKATWTKEVDKMVKWGAVVDAADRDVLIDYLSANFSPDKPAYDPPRTSKEKISGKNTRTLEKTKRYRPSIRQGLGSYDSAA